MSEQNNPLLRKAAAAYAAGKLEAALASCLAALRQNPQNFDALHLAGTVAGQTDRLQEAVDFFQRAYRVRPRSGSSLICLGLALTSLGRPVEAENALKAGLALDSVNPEAWMAVGYFLRANGRDAEALNCYRHVLKLKAAHAGAYASIAGILKATGDMAQAMEHYRLALELTPRDAEARLGLVETLNTFHRTSEALAECDRILALQPRHVQAHSHRLFLLNYSADISAERLFEEHRRFGRLFPAPHRRAATPADPAKRLRVAFLSPDLRAHAVSSFLEPLLAHIDSREVEVVLYHDHQCVDAVSERLRTHAALWRNFWGRSDSQVADTIRADAPDVMVDLAGHSGQNRLPLFARRLAPVQVSYLGYPNTTGLPSMDYRLTDDAADPEGVADRLNVETLVRFSPCAWAYRPPTGADAAPDIAPAGERESVTFGSFNTLSKVNDATLQLWSRVLSAVHGSRLVLKGYGISAERLVPRFAKAGIDSSRVTLLEATPDNASHLACYQQVDIALDPFPYGGTTTTCEALWMGRPVVTLAGDRHSGRVGASLLRAIGKAEWIARDPDAYVRIAAGLASNASVLRSESLGLRVALQKSPLLDHPGQARRFTDALRACWARGCNAVRQGAPGSSAGRSLVDSRGQLMTA